MANLTVYFVVSNLLKEKAQNNICEKPDLFRRQTKIASLFPTYESVFSVSLTDLTTSNGVFFFVKKARAYTNRHVKKAKRFHDLQVNK